MIAWRALAVLPSILLGAAAAPPGDCSPRTGTEQTLPTPLDLAGRPNLPTGLAGEALAPPPSLDAPAGCGGTSLPSTAQVTPLRSETGDVLHGLPQPDILRRVDEPQHAPEFQ
jgi:hypothetical protein